MSVETFGLQYPGGQLESFTSPVSLNPNNNNTSPSAEPNPNPTNASTTTTAANIPALDASTFSKLHLQHLLSHPPDSALFPFLHGLEGANDAQNSFFQTGFVRNPDGRRGPAKVPRFRGRIVVSAEDEEGESEDEDDEKRILKKESNSSTAS